MRAIALGMVIGLVALQVTGCDGDNGVSTEDGGAARELDGGTGGAQVGGGCDGFCQKLAESNCESFTLDACLSGCRLHEVAAEGTCEPELDAYLGCHRSTAHRCESGFPQTETCVPQSVALDNCEAATPRVCEPVTVAACDTCIAEQCCVVRDSCDSACLSMVACYEACGSTDCKNQCVANAPVGTLGIVGLYASCRAGECERDCEPDEN